MGAATKKNTKIKALFVIDPIDTLNHYKDSSLAFMRSFGDLGAACFICGTEDLTLKGAKGFALGREITVGEDCRNLAAAENKPLESFDYIFMRKDPPVDKAYLYATYMLEAAERKGVKVINPPKALRDFNEKLFTLLFPSLIPETLFSADKRALQAFAAEYEKIILKPADGMGGRGVFLSYADDPNFSVIWETLTENGQFPILAQRFIPEIKQGDKRVLILNGEAFPYSLARIPGEKSVRGNLAAGGEYEARPLSKRDRDIAKKVAVRLKQENIALAGIDIIGDYLTEINITSPTCFVELERLTDIDPSEIFVKGLIGA